MFNSNNGYSLADVAAATGNNRNNDGMWGDGGWWIILLFLVFGYGGFGAWGNGLGGNAGTPCATQADVRAAVDQQTLISKLDQQTYGLADSTYALNNTINSNFRTMDNAVCNLGFNVQQGFNTTNVALMQAQNALQTQLANCCCENREGQAQIRYDMATNTCALQNTMNNNTRDIIDNQNAGAREILNYLCQKENADLRDKVQRLELAASQSQQNAYITANQEAQTAELVRRLGRDYPVNAVVVQPNTPVTFPVNGCGNFTGYNSCNGCCC